jgi:cell division initiation protein
MSRYPGFRVRFRGFDRAAVVAAFSKLTSENADAWREIDRMEAEIKHLQASMIEQSENERHVQRALVTATKVAEEIRARAEDEAREVLRDARERGDAILQQLRDQATELEGQIHALLVRRRDAEASIEALVKALSLELEQGRQYDQLADASSGEFAKTG